MRAAVLFDIDGTLVDARGAGRAALERALAEWTGFMTRLSPIDFAGRTDLEIFRAMVRLAGRPQPDDATRRAIMRRYAAFLPEELQARPESHACPGVQELLVALTQDPRWILALATGNTAAGAYAKLRHLELEEPFLRCAPRSPLLLGGFGDEAEDRNVLVPQALFRIEGATGLRMSPENVVVVGDTERDIMAARAAGVPVLAVASGMRSEAQLAAAQPDALLPDLSDTKAALRILDELGGLG